MAPVQPERRPVRVLAVSDEIDEALWHDRSPRQRVDLVVACGDLPFEYLAALMRAFDVPLVFVPGNHDPDVGGYRVSHGGLLLQAGLPAEPPWPLGATNADGQVVDVAGLRLAGLGGCLRYGKGPNQYTDREQARRVRRLTALAWWRRHRDGREVDVVLTHAPPSGVGDGDDPVHRGFTAFHGLIRHLEPTLLLHGHVDRPTDGQRDHRVGTTIVRNVVGRAMFEVEPATAIATTGRRRGA